MRTVSVAFVTLTAVACNRGSARQAPPAGSASSPAAVMPGCAKDTDCKGDRVCQGGQCVEPGSPGASGGSSATDESTARQSWIAGPLLGRDNSAAAMKGARISGSGPYRLHIDNQFGFTCAVEFDANGHPARLSECNAPNGWHFKSQSIALHCSVDAKAGTETCSGSTGGLASKMAPNDYSFDGLALARPLHPGASQGPAQAQVKTFPCNGRRCRPDQVCCPGGPPGTGSCMAYDPNSPMFCRDVWEMCDPATNEPCVAPQRCKPGSDGRNPTCSP